jgi:TRAP-type C4-dicarboxylate transport system substrate-binding protein
MDPLVLTWSDGNPPESTGARSVDAFMDYVESESDGKVTFERFYLGALTPPAEALSATQSGVADIATVQAVTYHPDELPISNWYYTFGAHEKDGGTLGFLQEALTTFQMFTENEAIVAEFASLGLKPLAGTTYTYWSNHCISEVSSPQQAEGKRVSAVGEALLREMQALGFTTQLIASPDVYEALQRGAIDCVTRCFATSQRP